MGKIIGAERFLARRDQVSLEQIEELRRVLREAVSFSNGKETESAPLIPSPEGTVGLDRFVKRTVDVAKQRALDNPEQFANGVAAVTNLPEHPDAPRRRILDRINGMQNAYYQAAFEAFESGDMDSAQELGNKGRFILERCELPIPNGYNILQQKIEEAKRE